MNIFYNQALKQTQNLKKDLNLFQSFITNNTPLATIPLQGRIQNYRNILILYN